MSITHDAGALVLLEDYQDCGTRPVEVKAMDRISTSPARRFEAGTPAIPNIYGAKRGVELLMSIGMENVADHIAMLTSTALSRAKQMGLQTKTIAESVGPLVVLRCLDAAALVEKLAARNIVVSSRHDGLRLGLHVYNTVEDIDAVFEALGEYRDLLRFEPAQA